MTDPIVERPHIFDLVDEDGRLGRAIGGDAWWVPGDSLQLEGSTLKVDPRRMSFDGFIDGHELFLERFVRLHRASDLEVLRFARRYGLLNLCDHGLPATHPNSDLPVALATSGGAQLAFDAAGDCRQLVGEPLDVWRFWSRQAHALLKVIAYLRVGQGGSASDWSALSEPGPWARYDRAAGAVLPLVDKWVRSLRSGRANLERQRLTTAAIVSTWSRLGNVRTELQWRLDGQPMLALSLDGLFGALGMQVAAAAAGVRGVSVCPECGTPHAPTRGLRSRSFCQRCRDEGAPERWASRDYRLRRQGDPHYKAKERVRARKNREAQRHTRAGGSLG